MIPPRRRAACGNTPVESAQTPQAARRGGGMEDAMDNPPQGCSWFWLVAALAGLALWTVVILAAWLLLALMRVM